MPLDNPFDLLDQENQALSDRISQVEELLDRLSGHSTVAQPSDFDPEEDIPYRQIFEDIAVCMFVIEPTEEGRFRVVRFNKAEETATGLKNDIVAGKFVEDILPPDVAREVTARYQAAIDAGSPISYENDLNLPAGRRSFHSTLIPLRNAAGRTHRIIGACIDITDSKRKQMESLARQKLECVGVLAGGIAHDIGNLVGSVLAQSEALLEDLPEDSPTHHGISCIRNVAIRAGEIVQELMAYAGQEETPCEPLDLSSIVAEMLRLLKACISKRAVLRVDLPAGLAAVLANPAQIRQVVMNLITNASDALGDKEGLISLRVAETRLDSEVSPQKGDFIRLVVTDTGCGMTEEVQSRIFDPFYSTKLAGRGLGLAAVQGIIRSHGGLINVRSTPGRGSQFEILLPACRRPVPARSELQTSSAMNEPRMNGTVLLVEDEELLRRTVGSMLRRMGFGVIEADDGRAAVSTFTANQKDINVVLLDLTLPKLSGWEVLDELRRIRPEVKVVLTTAYSRQTATVPINGQPVWGFIRKPYRLNEISEVLRKACHQDGQT